MQNSLDSNHNIAMIQIRIQEILTVLANKNFNNLPKNAIELQEREKQIHALTRELGDCYTAINLQHAFGETKEIAAKMVRNVNPTLKNKGLRIVNIRFLGGTVIQIICNYYTRNCDDRRKKRAKGYYPGLFLYGIYDHCTPELASIISMSSAALCSLEEAKHMLENRNRYHTDWREPKLLIIYIVDDKGRSDSKMLPIIDGIIGEGTDATFALIESYLKKIEITQEDNLLFIADGALWIWERTKQLKESLNLKEEQFYELLDFYHATEHLNDLASMKTTWSESERKRWINKQKSRLKAGQIDDFITAIKSACMSSTRKEIEREREFFIKNASRMNYGKMTRLKFPMGSGAMESAVRRVINLRLKSPGIFWHEQTANEMLMLRSYYKAKRWNLLNEMALSYILEVAA